MASIMEGDDFMEKTNIAAIVAKFQWICRDKDMMRRMKMMSEKQIWRQFDRFIKEITQHSIQYDISMWMRGVCVAWRFRDLQQ